MIIFDIETSALPDAELTRVKPEFKPAANLRDPEKIKASVIEKELAWRERAALDAKTAQILAIGLLDDTTTFLTGPEPAMLEAFWAGWRKGERMVGFNIKGFDLPMLYQRSIILGVHMPGDLMNGRYWHPRVVDLQELWNCYGRETTGQSLDAICKACGLGQKTGSGADFAKLFATDRKAALDYLGNDLELTAALAKRLGIS